MILVLLPMFGSVKCWASKADVYASGGATFSNLTNVTAVQINNNVTNNYHANTSVSTQPLLGLGIGHTFNNIFNRSLDLSLSLAGYYANFSNIQGTEYPFANVGNFDTLSYQFKAYSLSLMIEPRLIYTQYIWQPFLLAGIGSAWNRLYSYNETSSNSSSSAASVPYPSI